MRPPWKDWLVRTALWPLLASTVFLAACRDNVLTNTQPPPLRADASTEAAPMVVPLEELFPFYYFNPIDWGYLSNTDPTVFFHFVHPWSYFTTNFNPEWITYYPALGPSLGVGWVYDPTGASQTAITFSKPVSRVRMLGLSGYLDLTLRCTTKDGVEVISRLAGDYNHPYAGWRELDISGAGIRRCVFDSDGGFIKDVSIVPEIQQQPKIVLPCNPGVSLTRGDSIACVATAVPAALQDSLIVREWSFNGIPRQDGDLASTTWAGSMVNGGTIRVRGTLKGAPVQDSVSVQVNARRWPRLQAANPAHDSLGGDYAFDLPATPRVNPSSPFGYVLSDFADSHLMRSNLPYTGRTAMVSGGPNDGWWYVSSPLARPYLLVHHSAVLNPGTPWYQSQHSGGPGQSGWLPYCSKHDINLFRERALLHEGLKQTPVSPGDLYQPADTHFTFFRDWMNTHDVNRLFEAQTWTAADPAVAAGFDKFEQMLEFVWVTNVQDPHTQANHAVVDTQSLVPITCRAR